jgi:hypothetical protein
MCFMMQTYAYNHHARRQGFVDRNLPGSSLLVPCLDSMNLYTEYKYLAHVVSKAVLCVVSYVWSYSYGIWTVCFISYEVLVDLTNGTYILEYSLFWFLQAALSYEILRSRKCIRRVGLLHTKSIS